MTKYWISDELQDIYPQPEAAKVALDALEEIQDELMCLGHFNSRMKQFVNEIKSALQTPASDGVLDTWTLPYKSSDSDERIRKVIKTLALPENSTVVWGALKQLENEIRFALVADYNALKQSTAKD